MFACLVSRAVHLVVDSIDTDSFINTHYRFIGRRVPVPWLRSDRDTDFVGAKSELYLKDLLKGNGLNKNLQWNVKGQLWLDKFQNECTIC